MAKVSLKREIAGILETAMPCGTIINSWDKEQTQYRATVGSFTCTFATDNLNSREEVVEGLKKQAETMFRKKSERMDGGLNRQKQMALLMQNRHLLQDIADVRYQHLVNGYTFEKAMRLVYDYKKKLPVEVTKITRHCGSGEFINVYSIPLIDMHWAVELLPLLPPAYLKDIELGC